MTRAGSHSLEGDIGSEFSHLFTSEGTCANPGCGKELRVLLAPSCWLFCPSRVREGKCIQSDGSPQPVGPSTGFIPSGSIIGCRLPCSRRLFQSSGSHKPGKSRYGPRLHHLPLSIVTWLSPPHHRPSRQPDPLHPSTNYSAFQFPAGHKRSPRSSLLIDPSSPFPALPCWACSQDARSQGRRGLCIFST